MSTELQNIIRSIQSRDKAPQNFVKQGVVYSPSQATPVDHYSGALNKLAGVADWFSRNLNTLSGEEEDKSSQVLSQLSQEEIAGYISKNSKIPGHNDITTREVIRKTGLLTGFKSFNMLSDRIKSGEIATDSELYEAQRSIFKSATENIKISFGLNDKQMEDFQRGLTADFEGNMMKMYSLLRQRKEETSENLSKMTQLEAFKITLDKGGYNAESITGYMSNLNNALKSGSLAPKVYEDLVRNIPFIVAHSNSGFELLSALKNQTVIYGGEEVSLGSLVGAEVWDNYETTAAAYINKRDRQEITELNRRLEALGEELTPSESVTRIRGMMDSYNKEYPNGFSTDYYNTLEKWERLYTNKMLAETKRNKEEVEVSNYLPEFYRRVELAREGKPVLFNAQSFGLKPEAYKRLVTMAYDDSSNINDKADISKYAGFDDGTAALTRPISMSAANIKAFIANSAEFDEEALSQAVSRLNELGDSSFISGKDGQLIGAVGYMVDVMGIKPSELPQDFFGVISAFNEGRIENSNYVTAWNAFNSNPDLANLPIYLKQSTFAVYVGYSKSKSPIEALKVAERFVEKQNLAVKFGGDMYGYIPVSFAGSRESAFKMGEVIKKVIRDDISYRKKRGDKELVTSGYRFLIGRKVNKKTGKAENVLTVYQGGNPLAEGNANDFLEIFNNNFVSGGTE